MTLDRMPRRGRIGHGDAHERSTREDARSLRDFVKRERAADRKSGRAATRRHPWVSGYSGMPSVESQEDLA